MIRGSTAVTIVRSTAPTKTARQTRVRVRVAFREPGGEETMRRSRQLLWAESLHLRNCSTIKSAIGSRRRAHVNHLVVLAEADLPGCGVGRVGRWINQHDLSNAHGVGIGPQIGLDR